MNITYILVADKVVFCGFKILLKLSHKRVIVNNNIVIEVRIDLLPAFCLDVSKEILRPKESSFCNLL